ncbi:pyridoxal phosphate-dependent aminotransferase [Arenivirga flava]|uniref:Aminotransferase n=1 Tax=Arenivirga flava TaxID=1930060 RepID=A0AA37UM99_9MICO|nr:aminotransferase class I/II-fold pyridoxal phosphate-dependent enzyme [Arenivirga flava]GMA29828.1 aminotransferase [Arenivirga flava]
MSITTTAPSFTPSEAVDRIERASRRVQQPQSTGDLVSLAMGEPNFDTPAVVREAAEAALAAGRTHYSPLYGEQSLRDEIAAQLTDRIGAAVSAADVLITQGGTGGLGAALLSLVSPGDKVVIPDPTYSLYADLVAMAGGELVPVPLGDDLHWDLDALAAALRGARLFVFCNPSNPTGIVHSRAELEALAGMLDGTETIVVSDEAYSELDFTGESFTSAIDVPALRERTIYCQTFSKTYAMTGWRVGYLWGPTDLIRSAARVHNTFNGSVNTAVQDAALAALRHAGSDVAAMKEAYLRRRELLTEALSGVPGLSLSSPEGAFYLFPKYDFDMPSVEVVAALREAGVAVRPGSEFGAAGEHHLRISYAASEDALRVGAERLAAGITALRSSQR